MLEYRAMGGLSVVDGGDELSLGGPRQRRLAAVLLIDRNRVVSVDRLGEVVFAGAPLPGTLPLVARLAVTTGVTVPLMTWVVMPRVTRLLHRWLYPDRRP